MSAGSSFDITMIRGVCADILRLDVAVHDPAPVEVPKITANEVGVGLGGVRGGRLPDPAARRGAQGAA